MKNHKTLCAILIANTTSPTNTNKLIILCLSTSLKRNYVRNKYPA